MICADTGSPTADSSEQTRNLTMIRGHSTTTRDTLAVREQGRMQQAHREGLNAQRSEIIILTGNQPSRDPMILSINEHPGLMPPTLVNNATADRFSSNHSTTRTNADAFFPGQETTANLSTRKDALQRVENSSSLSLTLRFSKKLKRKKNVTRLQRRMK